MAASLIPAFNQIRLSGAFASTTTDGRMRVGGNTHMVVSDSGAFTSVAVVNGMGSNLSGNLTSTGQALLTAIANTGQQAWTAANNNGINLSGNLTSTGVALGTRIDTVTTNLTTTGVTLTNTIIGLSGVMNAGFVKSINATGFIVAVATGADYQQVVYPFTFTAAPRVQLTMECSTQNIFYFCGVSNRTTTGFMALYSDTVLETGISLNVFASI